MKMAIGISVGFCALSLIILVLSAGHPFTLRIATCAVCATLIGVAFAVLARGW